MRYFFSCILVCLSGLLHAQQSESGITVTNNTDTVRRVAERVTIRHILVEGNRVTKRNIVLRELSVREGGEVAGDSLKALAELNWKRIFNLGLFADIHIETDTVAPDMVDWHIKLKEQWYIWPELSFKLADRNFNVWWTEQNRDIRRANLGVTLKHRNFRGNMEQLGVTAQVGYTQRFGIDYYKPYIDREQKHGIGASFFAEKNEETFYITDSNKLRFVKTQGSYVIRRFEAAVLYAYRPAYADRHLFELRFRDYMVADTILKLNPVYFDAGSNEMTQIELLYRFERNKVDNWNYPMSGHKVVGYLVNRFGFKGFDYQAYAMAEVGKFYRIHKRWYGSQIFRGRVSVPQYQPYAFRYAMGNGSEYLRGYEYYVIDGSHYGFLRNNLKYELLNVRIKNIPIPYLPVIPLRLYPKIYTDFGYGVNQFAGNSFLNNRFLYSAGAGIDIITFYDMKIRVEYSWNHLGEKGLFLHLISE